MQNLSNNDLKLSNTFPQSTILDVWQQSEWTSVASNCYSFWESFNEVNLFFLFHLDFHFEIFLVPICSKNSKILIGNLLVLEFLENKMLRFSTSRRKPHLFFLKWLRLLEWIFCWCYDQNDSQKQHPVDVFQNGCS